MSRILFINSVCGVGSTGRICTDLYDLAEKEGHQCCIAYGRDTALGKYNTIKIGNKLDLFFHGFMSILFDKHGFGSKSATKNFLKQVDDFNPDIIHLHNIHGYYLNIELLFEYLKKNPHIKVIWTLHDCWAFTGHCAYFTYSKCDKWKTGCEKCISKKSYPSCKGISNAKLNYERKKYIFKGVNDLVIITPSKWLADLVKDSYLNEYDIKVIKNGIDISIFNPPIQKKNKDKKIILGIANVWDERKGYDSFLNLSKKIDHEKYEIKLVGLNKKQLKKLPSNIKGIGKTKNIQELVKIYQNADILFNPTLEDNYPTVNLEAQACGTPVATYDSGGSKETLFLKESFVVKDVDSFISALNSKKIEVDFENINIRDYDKNKYFNKYLEIYKES